VTEDSNHALWLEQARSHLRNADPVLARLIDDRPDFDPRAWLAQLPPMDLYGALLFQVTGQQLSVPATRRTLARIQALFGGHPGPAGLRSPQRGQQHPHHQQSDHTRPGHRDHRQRAPRLLITVSWSPGSLRIRRRCPPAGSA
jgi:hypothetical protein